jgi:hypothetical protein
MLTVPVRPGQVWEFSMKGGPVRRARVVRVSAPIFGHRYVFFKRLTDGRSMRITLRRLQRGAFGARLVEEAPAEGVERKSRPPAEVAEPRPPSRTVHEPRISISDRRRAVARAHSLRDRGVTVPQIAKALCVTREVVEVWLAEEPIEST